MKRNKERGFCTDDKADLKHPENQLILIQQISGN